MSDTTSLQERLKDCGNGGVFPYDRPLKRTVFAITLHKIYPPKQALTCRGAFLEERRSDKVNGDEWQKLSNILRIQKRIFKVTGSVDNGIYQKIDKTEENDVKKYYSEYYLAKLAHNF